MNKLLFILSVFLIQGCTSKKLLIEKYNDGYASGLNVCQSTVVSLKNELEIKNDRLKRFNQLNTDGSLRGTK